jgi:hypothetical protein
MNVVWGSVVVHCEKHARHINTLSAEKFRDISAKTVSYMLRGTKVPNIDVNQRHKGT